jgi:hypothetical protein
MAKRFTATDRWDREWFEILSPRMKCAWDFITSKCDHAGIWIENYRALTFKVNCPEQPLTREELQSAFADRFVWIGSDKILIPGFMPFQYETLNPKVKVQASAIEILAKHGIDVKSLPWERYQKQPLAKGSLTLPDPPGSSPKGSLTLKDKDKDILVKGGAGGFPGLTLVDNSGTIHNDWTDPPDHWRPPPWEASQ